MAGLKNDSALFESIQLPLPEFLINSTQTQVVYSEIKSIQVTTQLAFPANDSNQLMSEAKNAGFKVDSCFTSELFVCLKSV